MSVNSLQINSSIIPRSTGQKLEHSWFWVVRVVLAPPFLDFLKEATPMNLEGKVTVVTESSQRLCPVLAEMMTDDELI